jgi:hypothetical protein
MKEGVLTQHQDDAKPDSTSFEPMPPIILVDGRLRAWLVFLGCLITVLLVARLIGFI